MSSKMPTLGMPKTVDKQYEEPDRDESLQKRAFKEDVESNLSVEVLARIQSALEQSRRIRQQGFAGINAEQGTVDGNKRPPVNQSK